MLSTSLISRIYTIGSLANTEDGIAFEVKNRLFDAQLTGIGSLRVDDEPVPLDDVLLVTRDGDHRAGTVTDAAPLDFPLTSRMTVHVPHDPLDEGPHTVEAVFVADPFGELGIMVEDFVVEPPGEIRGIPRNGIDDWTAQAAAERQAFVEESTGARLEHLTQASFDPSLTKGNIEHFTGVAQVPIGLAGPLLVRGEHARGHFLIPLATTEGTLVASYNRGMKVLNASGGVTCTVQDDSMQRAPVFVFDSAREARDFRDWLGENYAEIKEAAEATTSVGRLLEIETYLASRFAFCRFDFSTGDAAGQNMVGHATFAACSWILERRNDVRHFYLESNFATDKKASQVNVMHTRGKRVTAEARIPHQVLSRVMRVHPESLVYHSDVANVGAFLSGAVNNGLHSANGITAMFIACGQDVANVAESSAAVIHSELHEDFLYLSITLPSLIVATYGGGTGLATQRECLEMLGCTGRGSVLKLAEIVAGVVLAGEISLASAISSLDWVSSHEAFGRNR